MQRHAVVQNSFNVSVTPGISDEEALLVQLCEYLFDSGFLFNDADRQEVDQGQEVIQEFYEQEDELVMNYLSENLLNKFIDYLKEHPWSVEAIEEKIRAKIVKAFDELAYGTAHSLNIHRNIHLGLLQVHQHVLQDFLLYVTAYHTLILEKEDVLPDSGTSFNIDDLKNLRQKFQERMEGHKFVEMLLTDISHLRRGHMPLEEQKNRKPRKSYQFFRPSQHPQGLTSAFNLQTAAPDQTNTATPPSSVLSQASQENQNAQQSRPISSGKDQPDQPIPDPDLEDLEFEEESSNNSNEEANVVYGTGPVTQEAFKEFVQQNPDSALKFMFRRDLTEKGLPPEVLQIYEGWEERGLKRGHIRKYVLALMEWDNLPSGQTILELSSELKDKIYEVMHGISS